MAMQRYVVRTLHQYDQFHILYSCEQCLLRLRNRGAEHTDAYASAEAERYALLKALRKVSCCVFFLNLSLLIINNTLQHT
jgi:hypothetical protein